MSFGTGASLQKRVNHMPLFIIFYLFVLQSWSIQDGEKARAYKATELLRRQDAKKAREEAKKAKEEAKKAKEAKKAREDADHLSDLALYWPLHWIYHEQKCKPRSCVHMLLIIKYVACEFFCGGVWSAPNVCIEKARVCLVKVLGGFPPRTFAS